MNSKYVIVGAVVFVLTGIGLWVLNGKDASDIQSFENTPFEGLSINNGVKCTQTVGVGEAGNSVTSTIYYYKEKMRYDSVMKDEVDGQKDLHVVIDNDYTYTWGRGAIASMTGGGNKGIKMSNYDENNEYTSEYDAAELEASDFNVPGLACEKWSPDNSFFELPDDTEFLTLDEMMGQTMGLPPTGGESADMPNLEAPYGMDICAMCDSIPDEEARAECKISCQE